MRKGEELKTPRHASAAASRDDRLFPTVIVVVNCLIKMRYIIPMDLINAILVAKCFIKYVFKLYRLSNTIISNHRS